MNVGVNELSISPSDNPHGAGVGKSAKESTVADKPMVSFASRLEALHGRAIALRSQNMTVITSKPVTPVPASASALLMSNKALTADICDHSVEFAADVSTAATGTSAAPAQQPVIELLKSIKPESAVSEHSSGSANVTRNVTTHPVVDNHLGTKHSETTKQPLVHLSGLAGEVPQPTARSIEAVVTPFLASFGINQMQPQIHDFKQTADSPAPIASGVKDKIAKAQVNTPAKTTDPVVGTPSTTLQHLVVSGAAMTSEDAKSASATQELLLAKTSIVENASPIDSLVHLSSVPFLGGIAPSPIRLVESSSNTALLENSLRQHHLEASIASPEANGYTGDGTSHTVVLANTSTLEVGLHNGTHGWVKIRAEIDGGGLVHATLSSRSTSGQEMLHRELPGLARFLAMEHVAVQPTVAERSLVAGLDSAQGNSSAADPHGGSERERSTSAGSGDSLAGGSDGVEHESTTTGRANDVGALLLSRGSGSWLNVRV